METGEKNIQLQVDVIDFETRRYPRFNIRLPIEYNLIKSSTTHSGLTHTGTISEGGLLIYLPERKNLSQYLSLKLFFSLGSELKTVEVLAEVIWADDHLSEAGEYYPHGVKFVDIFPEDDIKLKDLLRSLSSPSDDIPSMFNPLKTGLWIRKLMNFTGAITTEKII